MKKIVVFFLLWFLHSQGKTSTVYTCVEKPLSIQYIHLLDPPLLQYLEKYIKEVENKNELFRNGLGFIVLENISYSASSGRPLNDAIFNLSINSENKSYIDVSVQVYPLLVKYKIDCIKCNYFPPYYTIVGKKIVLIYENNILGLNGMKYKNDLRTNHVYSKKSKKKLSKILNDMAIVDLPHTYIFEDFIESILQTGRFCAKKPLKLHKT